MRSSLHLRFLIVSSLLLLAPSTWAANWSSFHSPASGSPEAIGKYANGCLLGGTALPDAGPGYQAVRLARSRNYGHPWMIDFIEKLGQRVSQRGLGIMLVADLAMPRGGRFSSGHKSHQSGLDADIWLRLDAPVLPASQRQAYDAVAAKLYVNRKTWVVTPDFRWKHAEMIRQAALDERVARIFVNPAIKKNLCQRRWDVDRSWLRKLRPWWGHDSHFHVRLHCPPNSKDCTEQAPPPAGEGCGEAVDKWLADFRKPPKPRKPRPTSDPAATPKPTPPPPLRCQALLQQ